MRPSCHEILAADRAADGEKSFRQRRRNAGQFGHRNQKRQTEAQILPHVAVLGQHDPLAPVAGIGQPIMRAAAIHPLLAFAGVMMRQRKMRAAIAKSFAHRDALGIERVGDPADRGLRAFLVNVPALEMLDRAGIHDDQRRMDDRPGIHQRARQRVAARLDHAGKRAADHIERVIGSVSSGNTPTGSRLARMVMATSNGPCLRVSQGSVPVSAKLTAARLPASCAALAKIIEPKVAGGRNTTWPSRKMRREQPRDIGLREGRGRAQDQLGAADGFGDVGRHQRQLHVVPAVRVLDDECASPPRDVPPLAPHRAATA